jgi:hypothetical protein
MSESGHRTLRTLGLLLGLLCLLLAVADLLRGTGGMRWFRGLTPEAAAERSR